MNFFVIVIPLLMAALTAVFYRYKKQEVLFFVLCRLIGMSAVSCGLISVVWEAGDFSHWRFVFANAVGFLSVNFVFSLVLKVLKDQVDRGTIHAAVNERAEELANRIVAGRDRNEFLALRNQKLAEEVRECFDDRLQVALQSEAYRKIEAELRAMNEGDNLGNAIWIGLHGASKVLGGCDQGESHEMLAVPYWIKYQLDKSPVRRRFNQTHAVVMPLSEISFIAKRWSKVDGENALVLDGALVYPPLPTMSK